ncbi:putative polysaccharide biosynthesis protein [Kurthia massiliensis]|uniref:putative polysaccharide biosynthesis protein n=1 Tax=Kurthia massiliensis TaxID=1033739 RepID=UPI000287B19A|nr:oligosaccharide flippase family protein [Kurthia massiliensis]
MSESNVKQYAKGVMTLTIAMLFVKVLSMVYRIPFQNLVGDEGFYIYQQVYPFVAVFMTWTASGLAVAISRVLTETNESWAELMKVIMRYLIGLAVVLFALLYSLAGFFASMMGDKGLVPLLKAGSYITLTIPMLALYKGYAQATSALDVVAKSQVVEQIVRVAIILVGTWLVMRIGASLYVAGEVATVGTVIGEVAGVLLLYVLMRRKGVRVSIRRSAIPRAQQHHLMKRLAVYSVGISLSSLLLILFQLVDSFTIFEALKRQMSVGAAMAEKGAYDRGQPLVQVGLVLASTLAMAIVPMITTSMKRADRAEAARYMGLTYRVSVLIGVAASVGLMLVMPYMNVMMFKTTALSTVLSLYVLQILWLSIIMPMMAVLQGLGYTKHPSLLLIGSLIVKLLCNDVFIQTFGIAGAALASNLALALTALLLVRFLKKVYPVTLTTYTFTSGLIVATIAMGIVVELWITGIKLLDAAISMPPRLSATFTALSAVIVGAAVFLVVATKKEVLSVNDWYVLPLGRRVAAFQLYVSRVKK